MKLEIRKFGESEVLGLIVFCFTTRLNGIFGNVDLLFHYLNMVEDILQKRKAFNQVTDSPKLNENSVEYLMQQISLSSKSVLACIEHQKCMTDDVLQLPLLGTSKISITNAYYYPDELFQTIIRTFRAQAEQKVIIGHHVSFVTHFYTQGYFS
jgi:hypothetical protein